MNIRFHSSQVIFSITSIININHFLLLLIILVWVFFYFFNFLHLDQLSIFYWCINLPTLNTTKNFLILDPIYPYISPYFILHFHFSYIHFINTLLFNIQTLSIIEHSYANLWLLHLFLHL